MKILLVDNGSKYINKLQNLIAVYNYDLISYSNLDILKAVYYDLIILSGGSKYSVEGNNDRFFNELNVIRTVNVPILGICLGFEMIVKAFGGDLVRMNNKIKGLLTIKAFHKDPVFNKLDNIEVYESHRWVVNDLPSNLIALAESKDGIEIVKHKNRIIYGFQFHPEMFLEKSQGDELFSNFLKFIK